MKVVSTLLESGFSQEVLGVDRLTKLVDIVGRAFDAEEGLIGFGRSMIATEKTCKLTKAHSSTICRL